MAYDEYLADRIRNRLIEQHAPFEEKKMMGGLCFMVDDKMCIGVVQNAFMARIDPDSSEKLMSLTGVRPMDFTGKRMKGFLFVDPEGIDSDEELQSWVNRCLEFNPFAKSSKKRK